MTIIPTHCQLLLNYAVTAQKCNMQPTTLPKDASKDANTMLAVTAELLGIFSCFLGNSMACYGQTLQNSA